MAHVWSLIGTGLVLLTKYLAGSLALSESVMMAIFFMEYSRWHVCKEKHFCVVFKDESLGTLHAHLILAVLRTSDFVHQIRILPQPCDMFLTQDVPWNYKIITANCCVPKWTILCAGVPNLCTFHLSDKGLKHPWGPFDGLFVFTPELWRNTADFTHTILSVLRTKSQLTALQVWNTWREEDEAAAQPYKGVWSLCVYKSVR